MDVTSQQGIDEAKKLVESKSDKLDVIINFAGIGLMDSLIEGDVSKMQKVMDINLFGMVRVNKTFFPLIQNAKGRIINISSENGYTSPSPFNGPYAMSKFAVEAYNHSLRRELNLLDIKVIDIQPGSFKTNMHNNVRKDFEDLKEKSKLYQSPLSKMGKMMASEMENANDFSYLFETLVEAINSDNPKIIYRVKNSKALRFLNMLSDKKVDSIYMKNLK